MDSLTVRFKADDPATLERLRTALAAAWLAEPTTLVTVADVTDVRVTYIKEN